MISPKDGSSANQARTDQAESLADEILDRVDLSEEFEFLINATEEDLSAVHADGMNAALRLLTIDFDTTTNEARARFGLSPVPDGDDVPVIVNQVDDRAVAYARDRGAELVTQIAENTRDMIRGDVVEAILNGDGAATLAKRLVDSAGFSQARAERIARTELIRAENYGALNGYKESGVATGKAWLTANDDRVCDETCAPNEDDGPIGIDDDFLSGDPCPPGHPNCRCTIVPWTEPLE